MSRFLSKLKGAVSKAIDPTRPQRIADWSHAVETALRAGGSAFAFEDWCNASGLTPDEQHDVADRVYGTFFARASRDDRVSERERQDLSVAARILGLSVVEQQAVERAEVVARIRQGVV